MATSRLLRNPWFGKAIGGVTGLLLAAPQWWPSLTGVCIGVVCGDLFDRWASRHLHSQQISRLLFWRNPRALARARPAMQFTFSGMGRIAKSSGCVLPAHIDYAEQLMSRLGFCSADREQAIAWFSAGKDPDFSFQKVAQGCLAQNRRDTVLLEMALECLCGITLLDDNDQARTTLYSLAEMIGIDQPTCDRTCQQVASLSNSPPAVLARAYSILDANPTQTDQEIKTAYRRLVARHHPDRIGVDANPQQIKLASDRLAEFREALEIVEANRVGG